MVITDEQAQFDLTEGFDNPSGRLLTAQAHAVSTAINAQVGAALTSAPYEVVIGKAKDDVQGALIEARRVLNLFRVPDQSRILVVGSDFEAALLQNPTLTLASAAGEGRAESAIGRATLGNLYGFRVVVDLTVPSDTAFAVVPTALSLFTGAPPVPHSQRGATLNRDGLALRWMTDYDSEYLRNRSVVDAWAGSTVVKDKVMPQPDKATAETPQSYDPATLKEYFLRGVKLTLDGASVYPDKTQKADLVKETGVSADKKWTPRPKA